MDLNISSSRQFKAAMPSLAKLTFPRLAGAARHANGENNLLKHGGQLTRKSTNTRFYFGSGWELMSSLTFSSRSENAAQVLSKIRVDSRRVPLREKR